MFLFPDEKVSETISCMASNRRFLFCLITSNTWLALFAAIAYIQCIAQMFFCNDAICIIWWIIIAKSFSWGPHLMSYNCKSLSWGQQRMSLMSYQDEPGRTRRTRTNQDEPGQNQDESGRTRMKVDVNNVEGFTKKRNVIWICRNLDRAFVWTSYYIKSCTYFKPFFSCNCNRVDVF